MPIKAFQSLIDTSLEDNGGRRKGNQTQVPVLRSDANLFWETRPWLLLDGGDILFIRPCEKTSLRSSKTARDSGPPFFGSDDRAGSEEEGPEDSGSSVASPAPTEYSTGTFLIRLD